MTLANSHRAAWGRIRSQSGAFDLPSIMIGVAVVAILTVGVLAAIFGVIPWAQDRAAQQDLAAVHTAQGAAYSKDGGFKGQEGLVGADLLPGDLPDRMDVRASADGLKYVGVNYSATGNGYIITSEEPTPRGLFSNDKWLDGTVIDPNAPAGPPVFDPEPIMVTTWRIGAGQTLRLPMSGNVNVTIDWGDGGTTETVTGDSPSHRYSTANATQVVVVTGEFDKWGGFMEPNREILLSVDRWGETGTTDLKYAFHQAINLKHVEAIPWTTTSLTYAFSEVPSDFTLGSLNTSSVTDMVAMFLDATKFNQPLNFDAKSLTETRYMFSGATSFDSPLTFINTSNVTSMQYMFEGAKAFDSPLTFTDTSNVKDMGRMFQNATKFNQPLDFDTKNVETIANMFYNATAFDQDLSEWDVGKVVWRNSFGTGSKLTDDHLPRAWQPRS